MYAETHPEAETLTDSTTLLVNWINEKEAEGKLTIEETRELVHLITDATEETLIKVIGKHGTIL